MDKRLLPLMTAEVHQVNKEKGWHDELVPFGTSMALLHSEVSEALAAFRQWGTADVTPVQPCNVDEPVKPDGVGSEFADIFIRLLDDCERYGVDLLSELDSYSPIFEITDHESFGEDMDVLHIIIASASIDYGTSQFRHYFAELYVVLLELCEKYKINLLEEYRRKIAYNRTRPYRHGNKSC